MAELAEHSGASEAKTAAPSAMAEARRVTCNMAISVLAAPRRAAGKFQRQHGRPSDGSAGRSTVSGRFRLRLRLDGGARFPYVGGD